MARRAQEAGVLWRVGILRTCWWRRYDRWSAGSEPRESECFGL